MKLQMDKMFLFKFLFLPLSILIGISVWLHYKLDFDGFFVNLTTEVIGIGITIFYIDVMLRRYNKEKYAPADKRVLRRIWVFINSCNTYVRSSLGYGTDLFDQNILFSGDLEKIHHEIIRVAENIIIPNIPHRIKIIDKQGWNILVKNLNSFWIEADNILKAFGQRLEPEIISILIDIQDKVLAVLQLHQTFPDLLGVPDNELPLKTTGESSIPIKRAYTEIAGKELQVFFQLLIKLSDLINIKNSTD